MKSLDERMAELEGGLSEVRYTDRLDSRRLLVAFHDGPRLLITAEELA